MLLWRAKSNFVNGWKENQTNREFKMYTKCISCTVKKYTTAILTLAECNVTILTTS